MKFQSNVFSWRNVQWKMHQWTPHRGQSHLHFCFSAITTSHRTVVPVWCLLLASKPFQGLCWSVPAIVLFWELQPCTWTFLQTFCWMATRLVPEVYRSNWCRWATPEDVPGGEKPHFQCRHAHPVFILAKPWLKNCSLLHPWCCSGCGLQWLAMHANTFAFIWCTETSVYHMLHVW